MAGQRTGQDVPVRPMAGTGADGGCPPPQTVAGQRARRGQRAHLSGAAAEEQVAQAYMRNGMPICARRWRGRGGEIDIVARDGAAVVFIEVKHSRTHADAASHLSPRQMQRIWDAGSEFLAGEPRGSLTEVRIDLALVDGQGRIEILRNAYAA